jgi:haloalkane dehalogenase
MTIDFSPDPQLYPFESRWFDSSRGRMHYVDEGPTDSDAPPILFCHGNPTWSFLYRDTIVALRDRFRCIAPDYLGFGLCRIARRGSATRLTDTPALSESWSITSASTGI